MPDYFIGPDGRIMAGDVPEDYPLAPERPTLDHQWDIETQSWKASPINVEQVEKQIRALINQGQQAVVSNPLPLSRQREIYDLADDVIKYLKINAISLSYSLANAFDASGWEDIDANQKAMIAGLKAQILTFLPSPTP